MINYLSMKNLNSFSLNSKSKNIIYIYSINNLIKIYDYLFKKNIYPIIIGNGTNSIFISNIYKYILVNKIIGIKIFNNKKNWILHVNSGVNWNELVKYTLKNNIPGLENLAMIPGKVGAAPIYNIGAYGSEFKDFCIYVDILNLENKKLIRFSKKNCNFLYRYSIFQKLNINFFIVSVGIILKKKWKPNIFHKSFNINDFNKKNDINPIKIFNFISNLRKKNIPDYKILGNSGSIFKNPIISFNKIKKLKLKYNNIPYIKEFYNKYRISAGWLIEKCELKNFRIDDVIISNKNALIILNIGNAKVNNLLSIIKIIFNEVNNKFNIKLDLEVSLISNERKIELKNLKINNYIINNYKKINLL